MAGYFCLIVRLFSLAIHLLLVFVSVLTIDDGSQTNKPLIDFSVLDIYFFNFKYWMIKPYFTF